jgi:hypothetical protein
LSSTALFRLVSSTPAVTPGPAQAELSDVYRINAV